MPEDLQEAAKVDGATRWQRLWKVTLPNMKAAIMVALLFRTLDAWRIFDNPFIMTGGRATTPRRSRSWPTGRTSRCVNLGHGLGGLGAAVPHAWSSIAFVFVKGFKADLSQVRGER